MKENTENAVGEKCCPLFWIMVGHFKTGKEKFPYSIIFNIGLYYPCLIIVVIYVYAFHSQNVKTIMGW